MCRKHDWAGARTVSFPIAELFRVFRWQLQQSWKILFVTALATVSVNSEPPTPRAHLGSFRNEHFQRQRWGIRRETTAVRLRTPSASSQSHRLSPTNDDKEVPSHQKRTSWYSNSLQQKYSPKSLIGTIIGLLTTTSTPNCSIIILYDEELSPNFKPIYRIYHAVPGASKRWIPPPPSNEGHLCNDLYERLSKVPQSKLSKSSNTQRRRSQNDNISMANGILAVCRRTTTTDANATILINTTAIPNTSAGIVGRYNL